MISKIVLACLLATTSVTASWTTTTVGSMSVKSNTGGSSDYTKVVIMLHGGGGSAAEMVERYDNGDFGVTTNIKYVMPTSTHAGGVWYVSTKTSGCGGADDCAYELASITKSGNELKAVIDNEKTLKGWTDSSNIYLGGYSQGGQIASYVQIAKMTEKLGGVMIFCGFPLPPLTNMPGMTTANAKAAATYYGSDMRWMFIYGAGDTIFTPDETRPLYQSIFTKLGISSTIKIDHIEALNYHQVTSNGLANMVKFINGADTYDASTELAGGYGGDKGGGKDKEGDESTWCRDYNYGCPEGSNVLMASMASSLLLASLAYTI